MPSGKRVYLPLYEAKMIHQFDHRWATYDGLETRDLTLAEKQDPTCVVMPRYWVLDENVEAALQSVEYSSWMLTFRKTARSTDEHTVIATVLPESAVGDRSILLFFENGQLANTLALVANLDSFVLDFVARQKVGGTDISHFYFKQFPTLPPERYTSDLLSFIVPRVLELTYTAWDMQPFARDLGYAGSPFRWDSDRRFVIRCELDALYFHLYGITRADADYILDTFPIVRRKDEATHGYYRTKETILNIFDHMANNSYVSPLDPPAGDPRAAHSG